MDIFQPCKLGGINLKNRIIRAATGEGFADDDGKPNPKLITLYRKLQDGGVGAIISGCVATQKNSRPITNIPVIENEAYLEIFKKICQSIEAVPLLIQIGHYGGLATSAIPGNKPVAPSRLKYGLSKQYAHELDDKEIKEIINQYVKSILTAKKAGFEGIQLHAANATLLSEFLSPYFNRRTDNWGGSTENRFRIIKTNLQGF